MKVRARELRIPAGLLVAVLLLAGCASTPSGVRSQLVEYRIDKVTASLADTIDMGAFQRIDNEEDRDFVERVRAAVEITARDAVRSSLNGANPANVDIVLTRIDVASGVGRAVLGKDSSITAIVEVKDASSGAVLAQGPVFGRDRSAPIGGNIGGLIKLFADVSDAVVGDRVSAVAHDFSDNLKTWIEN